MQTIPIPDFGILTLATIVCDYNGTLAEDGVLLPGVQEAINKIKDIDVHVITADTFGAAEEQLKGSACQITIAPQEEQAQWKLNYIKALNPETTVCIGNGRNDRLMLKEAALGIALLQREGAAREAMLAADIVCTSALHALEYFSNHKRLIATLRS
ncbi:MAG: ATPase P [Candidatus Electrothrix sp. AW2]|nr:ATPase P [Candidatus Electrothrix sp. AX1]MCI5134515.1 ATPase P [Candidatus Electrothrix gigas]MCI5183417.1 ATPase P [Candidatus Electrothrix gigas]MCI5195675.1 ATPase P [Candidatus Electrothrix gigas]